MKNKFINLPIFLSLAFFISGKAYSMVSIPGEEKKLPPVSTNIKMTSENKLAVSGVQRLAYQIPLFRSPKSIQQLRSQSESSYVRILSNEELRFQMRHKNIYYALYELTVDQVSKAFGDEEQIEKMKKCLLDYRDRIIHYFCFIDTKHIISDINDINILVSSILVLKKGISSEGFKMRFFKKDNIEGVMGTLLLVSLIIAQKFCSDVRLKNAFWANTFGIQLDVLNESEAVFLKWIDYSVYSILNDKDIATAQQFLISK